MEAASVKPKGCTNFKLRQLARIVTQDYDAQLEGLGLKITQYTLLSHVLKLGPIRSVDLAKAMSMDSSTLSRNLKPLIAEGWISLEIGTDARSHLVVMTASGRQKRQEAQSHWHMAQEQLNKKLGRQRVAALHKLLNEALELLTMEQT
jgi:DNA-binding MarR family transcriptional regulator